eukprot:jgi/Undpi1/13118/HiC_scaffold_8.g02780.m1
MRHLCCSGGEALQTIVGEPVTGGLAISSGRADPVSQASQGNALEELDMASNGVGEDEAGKLKQRISVLWSHSSQELAEAGSSLFFQRQSSSSSDRNSSEGFYDLQA